MDNSFSLWVYLSTTPLLWLTVTLVAWIFADYLSLRAGRNPVVNPTLLAMMLVAGVLIATGTDYATYFEGAQFVHFLLGPATVALAVPLVRNFERVRADIFPMLAALFTGSVTAIISVLVLGRLVGLPETLVLSLAPKSVTTPVAMGIAEATGGIASLTALLVIFTGVFGAIVITPLMNAMGMRDFAARGFAAGLAAHGIGTARAFNVDRVAGTFSGIAMGLNAVLTALLVPLILKLFGLG